MTIRRIAIRSDPTHTPTCQTLRLSTIFSVFREVENTSRLALFSITPVCLLKLDGCLMCSSKMRLVVLCALISSESNSLTVASDALEHVSSSERQPVKHVHFECCKNRVSQNSRFSGTYCSHQQEQDENWQWHFWRYVCMRMWHCRWGQQKTCSGMFSDAYAYRALDWKVWYWLKSMLTTESQKQKLSPRAFWNHYRLETS